MGETNGISGYPGIQLIYFLIVVIFCYIKSLISFLSISFIKVNQVSQLQNYTGRPNLEIKS